MFFIEKYSTILNVYFKFSLIATVRSTFDIKGVNSLIRTRYNVFLTQIGFSLHKNIFVKNTLSLMILNHFKKKTYKLIFIFKINLKN